MTTSLATHTAGPICMAGGRKGGQMTRHPGSRGHLGSFSKILQASKQKLLKLEFVARGTKQATQCCQLLQGLQLTFHAHTVLDLHCARHTATCRTCLAPEVGVANNALRVSFLLSLPQVQRMPAYRSSQPLLCSAAISCLRMGR